MAAHARPGFSFLVCPDSELLKERLEEMFNDNPPASGSWKKIVFWGDEPPDSTFWNSLGQQGLFAADRAVVVRQAETWNAAAWKDISRALSRTHENIWPFFCLEVGFEKGKFKIPAHIAKAKCLIYAEKQGWVWKQANLNGPGLAAYIAKQAKKKGLVFSGEALELFRASVAPDARAIVNELDKLALLGGNGKISADMVAVDFGNPESDAFACVKKLQHGDINGVWAEIARGNASNLLFFLIAVLARELRGFWNFLGGENVYMHPSEAAFKRNLAKTMGFIGISNGFCALADAELQVKSGKMSPEQALEVLCLKLIRIFSPQNAG